MKSNGWVLGLVFLAATANAGLKVWNGSTDLWTDSANWMPAGVPAATDDVEVASGMSILLNGDGECASFEVAGSGYLIVNQADRTLEVGGDGLVDGGEAELRVNRGNLNMGGSLVLTNGGTLVLDDIAATATVQAVDFRDGTLEWNAGTLRLTDDLYLQNGNPVSNLTVDSGCTLDIVSTNIFASFLRLYDGGTLELNGGTAVCDEFTKYASGTLDFKDGVLQVNGDGFDWDGTTLVLDGATATDCPTLIFNDFFLPITATLTNGISVAPTAGHQGCLKVIEYSNLNAPVILGGGTGSTGMAIASNGATWTAGTLAVGEAGSGTLEILKNSRVQGCTKIEVGKESTATGIVTVAGAGSEWSGYWQTQIGGHGDAVISVSDGAILQFGDQTANTEFARYSGSHADLTLTDPGTEFGITSAAYNHIIYFGLGGHASLLVSNGASVTWDEFTTVGESSGSQGDIVVTGSNSSWRVNNDLWLGYEGASTLQVLDGATVHTDEAKLGEFPGGVGQVLVSGAGSTWHGGGYECIGGEFFVGRYGTGELTIEQGGTVYSSGYSVMGQYSGSRAFVTVTDTGSLWAVSGELEMGFFQSDVTSRLTVANGGLVRVAETASMADGGTIILNGGDDGAGIFEADILDLSSGGHITGDGDGILRLNRITGQDSSWTLAANLEIGSSNLSSSSQWSLGIGENLVLDGDFSLGCTTNSTFTQSGGTLESQTFTLGQHAAGSGTYTLSNGSLQVTTALVGYRGSGTLNIGNGGAMTCHNSLYVADDWDTQGSVTLGEGGTLSAHSLFVGQQGQGTFTQTGGINQTHHYLFAGYWSTGNGALFLSGGTHSVASNAYIGGNTEGTTSDGGTGMYTVSGGLLAIGGTLNIGYDGVGFLVVTNTGQVTSLSAVIGRYAGAGGQAAVTGNSASWRIAGGLTIGDEGSAALTVRDGGRVTADTVTVGAQATSTGNVVNLAGGMLLATNAAGTGLLDLERGTLSLDGGTAAADRIILGSQAALTGSGTLCGTLTNAGSISPGFSAGTLSVTGDVTLLSGSVLTFEVGGTRRGTDYDAIDISGTATPGGTLTVELDGYTPALADRFELLSWDAATPGSTFDTVNLPALPEGREWYTNDLNTDGSLLVSLPQDWLSRYGLSPTNDPFADPDGDSYSTAEEYTANTNPTNGASYFKVNDVDSYPNPVIHFNSSTDRMYSLSICTNMLVDTWADVPGIGPRAGVGGADSFTDTNEPVQGLFYYRLEVDLP